MNTSKPLTRTVHAHFAPNKKRILEQILRLVHDNGIYYMNVICSMDIRARPFLIATHSVLGTTIEQISTNAFSGRDSQEVSMEKFLELCSFVIEAGDENDPEVFFDESVLSR